MTKEAAPGSLNILAIVPYPFLPPTCGGDYSTMRLLNFLGEHNNVTLYTCEPYSSLDKLSFRFGIISHLKFRPWRYLNLLLVFELLGIIRRRQIDAVFMEQPWFWAIAVFIKMFSGKPFVMRANNIEYLRFRSMGKWWWRILFLYERWCLRSMDFVFFVSKEDRDRAVKAFGVEPEKTMVTPYGVEVDTPKTDVLKEQASIRLKYVIGADEKILLFFGSLDYAPNIEALDIMTGTILPMLRERSSTAYRFMVCGRRASPAFLQLAENRSDIIYAGFVEDIDEYIAAADLVMNPILSGGGIKTKAVDALALNRIVISTQTGAEGIDPALCGDNLVIVADKDWNAYTEAVIANTGKKVVMPAAFYRQFSWKGIAAAISDSIRKIIAAKKK